MISPGTHSLDEFQWMHFCSITVIKTPKNMLMFAYVAVCATLTLALCQAIWSSASTQLTVVSSFKAYETHLWKCHSTATAFPAPPGDGTTCTPFQCLCEVLQHSHKTVSCGKCVTAVSSGAFSSEANVS